MTEQPLISVIIPVYKAENTIRRAVQSVLRQTWENLEVLLVVDGSPDRSGQICDELAVEDERIRVFYMEDRGVSAARNLGLDQMRGEYFTFLDSDDAMAPEMLSMLHAALSDRNADIAGCQFKRCVTDEDFYELTAGAGNHKDTPGDAAVPEAAAVLNGTEIITQSIFRGDSRCWSKLYSESCKQIRFTEGLTIGEDMLYFLQCITGSTRYVMLNIPLYAYYINPSGAMERPFAPNHMDQLRCWKMAQEEIRNRFPAVLDDRESAAKLASIRAVYAVLTAGKIARLPSKIRRQYARQYEICREQLADVLKIPGCFSELSAGYKVKACMLRACPKLYLRLYGLLTG